jgi:hypothetical protein
VSLDRNLFFLFYNKLYDQASSIKRNEEIGGHSPVWAKRAQVENCRAYATPWPSSYNKEELRLMDYNNGESMILPYEYMDIPEHVDKASK